MVVSLPPFAPENLVSRDGFGSSVLYCYTVCRNIITVLCCCTVDLFFSPDIGLYKYVEFRVYCTISYVVCPNRIAAVLFVDPFCFPRFTSVQVYRVWYTRHNIICCVSKHDYCCTVDPFSPPDLGLYNCIEFSVHGTIPSVVCQNIITAVLLTLFSPPTYACTSI